MTNVQDILSALEQAAPYELAEDWDNVGLLVGDATARVSAVLCALDITETVIEEALEQSANLIVTHHPVIFTSVSRITEDTPAGRLLRKLIQANISVISMHTNLDCAQGGVNDCLAKALGLVNVVSMEAGDSKMLGRVGDLTHSMALGDFVHHVRHNLHAGGVRYVSGGKAVKRVAVGGGACGKLMDFAVKKGADTFVIGDSTYDQMQKAQAIGLNLIDAGHFPTENVVIDGLCRLLHGTFPEVPMFASKKHQDCILFA